MTPIQRQKFTIRDVASQPIAVLALCLLTFLSILGGFALSRVIRGDNVSDERVGNLIRTNAKKDTIISRKDTTIAYKDAIILKLMKENSDFKDRLLEKNNIIDRIYVNTDSLIRRKTEPAAKRVLKNARQ